jgi:hypothetical protein
MKMCFQATLLYVRTLIPPRPWETNASIFEHSSLNAVNKHPTANRERRGGYEFTKQIVVIMVWSLLGF